MITITLRTGERFDLDSFTEGYITAALWSSLDTRGPDTGNDPTFEASGLTASDLAPATARRAIEDCRAFQAAHGAAIEVGPTMAPDRNSDVSAEEYAGHDFWLTRNGHGVGFWDGDWPEPQATELTDAAHALGEVWWYVGDDGRIYQSGAEG